MNQIARRLALAGAAPLAAALAACSPHPAAGNWQGAGDERFTRLEVTYEGRASLYEAGEDAPGRHCFWATEGAQAVALSCKAAPDTAATEHYKLRVDENGTATLTADGKVVARFRRQ